MIASHSLTKQFGRFVAVHSVEFEIGAGQVVGFLGPNGAGKTTTIRMITGHLRPTAGTVLVDGLDIRTDALTIRRQLGYLPESAPLYTEMRVEEFLRFRARIFGIPRSTRAVAIDRALERCWLQSVRRRPINQLSKGYRQRVGLAAALLHEPSVLILDEPTVGLDPTQIREVRGLIRELAGDHTILLSTHILPEVELTCDEIIMIARGRIRAAGTVASLTGSEGHVEYVVETKTAAVAKTLRGLGGVRAVVSRALEDGWHEMIIKANTDRADLPQEIAATLAASKSPLRELHRRSPSLEHMFVQMVADAEAEFAAMNEAQHASEQKKTKATA